MSRRIALVSVLLTVIAGAAWYLKRPAPNSHTAHTHFHSGKLVPHTSKLSSGVLVEIKRVNTEPVIPGTPFTLDAEIAAYQDMPDARYEWILPKGVQMVSGSTSGFVSLKSEASSHIQGTFITHSEKGGVLRLVVKSTKGMRLARGRYDTFNQDRIDEEKSTLLERGRQYLEKNPEKVRKFQ